MYCCQKEKTMQGELFASVFLHWVFDFLICFFLNVLPLLFFLMDFLLQDSNIKPLDNLPLFFFGQHDNFDNFFLLARTSAYSALNTFTQGSDFLYWWDAR